MKLSAMIALWFLMFLPAVSTARKATPSSLGKPKVHLVVLPRNSDSVEESARVQSFLRKGLTKLKAITHVDLRKALELDTPYRIRRMRRRALKHYKKGRYAFKKIKLNRSRLHLLRARETYLSVLGYLPRKGLRRYTATLCYLGAVDFLLGKLKKSSRWFSSVITRHPKMALNKTIFGPGPTKHFELTRAGMRGQHTGKVSIYSKPSGARAYINGRFKGLTPLTVSRLPLGRHTFTVRAPSFYPRWTILRVRANRHSSITLRLSTSELGKRYVAALNSAGTEALKGRLGKNLFELGELANADWLLAMSLKKVGAKVNLSGHVLSFKKVRSIASDKVEYEHGRTDVRTRLRESMLKMLREAFKNR